MLKKLIHNSFSDHEFNETTDYIGAADFISDYRLDNLSFVILLD